MFITLEGIEGSGKSTQILHVVDFLNGLGLKCIMTREPGGTRIGRKIRSILLDPESATMNPAAELLLYTADRVQHIQEIILPMIESGGIVICDRYFDATLAYQGVARGLDMTLIQDLHKLICRNLKPDLTFLLDLSPDTGLLRAWKQLKSGSRMDTESRFENETLAFHERVRTGYLAIAEKEPERFRIIDASQSADQVQADISRILEFEIRQFMDQSAQDDKKCT
ncbi:MAG: dTMP kinase [Pseudomonadota bacterium]